MKREDLSGRKFGHITVIGWHHRDNGWQHFWECLCDCGNKSIVNGQKLRGGKTKSCGCLKRKINKTHGLAGKNRSPEYIAWGNMIQRCENPKNNNYSRYGARGVYVCERWKNSFEDFLSDMGIKPSANHSIGRKNNYGNYEPDNCKWETRSDQDRNKRSNYIIEYNGRSQIIKDWASELSVAPTSIKWHLSQGRDFAWVYNYFKK